jgi:polyhydroxyalkanoate synthesis regulator phasin
MSSFISNFIALYSKYDPTCKKWAPSQVRDKLIKLIDNNELEDNLDNKENESSERDTILITNGLLSETFNEKEEKDKARLITKLLNGEGIDISKLAQRFKKAINKNIIVDRKSIITFLKNKIGIDLIYDDEDGLNDILFHKIVLEGKEFIKKFIERYKLKKYSFNSQVFDDILINYQSFNHKSLNALNEYIKKFNALYNLYNPFIPVFNQIEKLINILKNNMKGSIPDNYSNCIDNIYSKFENNIIDNSQFESLNKEMKNLKEEISKLNCEFKKSLNEKDKEFKKALNEKDSEFQKYLNEKDAEINCIKARLTNLEKSIKSIEQEFTCPKAYAIPEKPIMTPSGNIYEEEKIKAWLKNHSKSPFSRNPLNEDQLIYSVHLRSAAQEICNIKQIK